MGSRGPKSGDSYTVTWFRKDQLPVMSCATSPLRAMKMAQRYRCGTASESDRIEVEGNNGAKWAPWVFLEGAWIRGAK